MIIAITRNKSKYRILFPDELFNIENIYFKNDVFNDVRDGPELSAYNKNR